MIRPEGLRSPEPLLLQHEERAHHRPHHLPEKRRCRDGVDKGVLFRVAGSAALDLANVACGRYDGFWEFNLNPWDTAAGALLVQEAGGRVTRFDGSPFRLDSREVLATNGLIHQELITNFEEIFAGRGLEPLPSAVEYAKSRK